MADDLGHAQDEELAAGDMEDLGRRRATLAGQPGDDGGDVRRVPAIEATRLGWAGELLLGTRRREREARALERRVRGVDVVEDAVDEVVGLALVLARVVLVAGELDLDVVLPLAVDHVGTVADGGLVAGVEVVEALLGDREEAGVAEDGDEARERAAQLDGERLVVDLLQTPKVASFLTPSFCISSKPAMRFMK